MSPPRVRNTASPFSIRLTDDEKALLQGKAAGVPLGIFIRGLLLGDGLKGRSTNRQSPLKDGEALGRTLALLGHSEIATSLTELAKHAKAGTLYCDDATRDRLTAACDDVRAMRLLLLNALGKEILNQVRMPQDGLSAVFAAQAAPDGDP